MLVELLWKRNFGHCNKRVAQAFKNYGSRSFGKINNWSGVGELFFALREDVGTGKWLGKLEAPRVLLFEVLWEQ